MKRVLALGLAGLIGIAMLYAKIVYPTYGYRFRMTVEVETPEGMRTGSGVYEVGAKNRPKLTSEEGTRAAWSKGEAVAVDLPHGRTLFALLKTGAKHGEMASLSMEAFAPAFKNDIVESAERIEKRQGIVSPAVVAPNSYPMLVTFRDITDPTSVALVDPANLGDAFGPGYRLKRIVIALTDDDVTKGIEKRLIWLDQQIGTIVKRRHGVPIGAVPPEYRLTKLAFRQGT